MSSSGGFTYKRLKMLRGNNQGYDFAMNGNVESYTWPTLNQIMQT
jgi:hypothetical protein